ncbi:efflux RND transporter permease subunit [Fluviicola taffensis]|uniref:Acriflavin resistance protein n=1 Tax=Fluviicola taffensis (strain DSM 16823 / NCIMB 13979 / RW262) TaxID=755732 RepID=F2IE52_FLUTR|nr:efflux RND transporter permease subunit [Fluviicola taffensis]AEA42370.1 acriflavin resistance protein [Fluviicola taffensis DSM 16823]
MNIASISINRPVLASVLSIIVVLFGVIGFIFLGVREFPSVDPPIITVTTNYVGANPDVIESQITEPLEESINGISGIRTVTSTSSDGRSSIVVEFDLSVDLDNAANDVRDKVSAAIRNLPPDADPPVVVKSDANAETIFSLTVQSDKKTLLELTDLGNNVFKERLQTIKGVSEIRIWGEKKFSMKFNLDPERMAGLGLTALDVKNALLNQNVELPSGRIEGNTVELTIRTFGRLTTEEEFNNLIVAKKGTQIVRLKDVGRANLAPENERTLLRGNHGIPMIGIAINPQPGANYIEIVDEIYKKVEQIKKELPKDVHLGVALDSTQNIRKSISEVEETILIAFGLVVVIIFLFLRDWRTTLIPIIAIPISLIGTFFIMYISNFSINLLTLLGIVLATGLVVDDAIVVMENIYARVERGEDPKEAAHKGSKEILFAIISTTITLTTVFLPIIFLDGLTGRLFREFGVVVAGSVIISAFISLTLTPMMSARLLKKKEKHSRFYKMTEVWLDKLMSGYRNSLTKFMKRPWIAFILMAFCIVLIIWNGLSLKSELAPMEDKGRFQIRSNAPEGTSFERMDFHQQQIIDLIDTLPEKTSIIAVTSPSFNSGAVNAGFVRVNLLPVKDRKRSQEEIVNLLNKRLGEFNFARSFIVQEQTIGGGRQSGLPVQYVLQAPNFETMKETLPKFLEQAIADPVFKIVDVDLKFNKPELQVDIDRDKAESVGVNVNDIASTLQLYFSGQRYGYFIMNGKQYQVIGQAMKEKRDDPSDLSAIQVRSESGELIPLDNLVTVRNESSPPQLFRYNRYVSATVQADVNAGFTVGDGIDAMDKIAEQVLPESFSHSLAGTSKEFAESGSSIIFAGLLALVLVFLVLAAQFESYRDPWIILFTVPLALAGALFSLWLTDQTLNIFSKIGIIVLIGLVTKNGILIVEFANQRREDGLSIKEAIIDACAQRFRPILMTTLATILGALPIALALGDAATSRISMGISIVGGLAFSLILTLFVIPGLYIYLTSKKSKLKP